MAQNYIFEAVLELLRNPYVLICFFTFCWLTIGFLFLLIYAQTYIFLIGKLRTNLVGLSLAPHDLTLQHATFLIAISNPPI